MSPSSQERDPVMFSTRVSLLSAALLAAAAVASRGQPPPTAPPPPPGGPVAALEDMLRQEAGPDLAARKTRINQLIGQMDLEELSRVLLLPDWRTLESAVPKTEAERDRIQVDLQSRSDAAERFRDRAKEAMKAAKAAPTGTTPAGAGGRRPRQGRHRRPDRRDGRGRPQARLPHAVVRPARPPRRAGKPDRLPRRPALGADARPDRPDEIRRRLRPAGRRPGPPIRRPRARRDSAGQPQPGRRSAGADSRRQEQLPGAASHGRRRDGRIGPGRRRGDAALARPGRGRPQPLPRLRPGGVRAVLRHGLSAGQPLEVRRAALHAFARIATEMLDIAVIPQTNESAPRELDPG